MRISNVEALVLEAPSEYGTDDDNEARGPKHTCIFVVDTDEGITGVSQVETQPHVVRAVVEAPGEASGLFSGLEALAIGEDPLQIETLWDRLYRGSYYFGRRGAVMQAISGIDLACWDILGKVSNLPISTLLGGRRRDRVRAYASTIFRESPDAGRAAMEGYLERGFTAVKFGWGPFGEDPRNDEAVVRAARGIAGDDIELMIDAGWRRRRTAKEAIHMVRSLEEFRPYWIEEPCFPEDYDTMRRVAEAVETRIAAGEAESTCWSFRELMTRGRVDVLQPDLSRCGGLTVARQVAYMAQEANVMVCAHAWGSQLLTAATLHFAAFLSGQTFLEFNVGTDAISEGLVDRPLQIVDGHVAVPTGPGLGVDPDMERIRFLQVA
jgi:L-alanine-DL-glutamate epimerase-like enolase superfamily enzyme